MSVELFFKAEYVTKRPLAYGVYVFICTLLSLFFSVIFSPQYCSILFLCFIVFTQMPVLVQILFRDEVLTTRGILSMREHPIFRVYTICIIASALAMIFFIATSSQSVSTAVQLAQQQVLNANNTSDLLSILTGKFFSWQKFSTILTNNFGVFNLIFIASLIFGGGALFILLWNVSVLVSFILQQISQISSNTTNILSILIHALSILSTILPHAIIEFAGYIIICVAGSMLGIAFVRHTLQSDSFKTVFKEIIIYYLIGAVLILAGAFIESLLITTA